jgi:dienelactone hydrolase
MRTLTLALLAVLASPAAFGAMQAEPVEWELEGTTFRGALVYDDAGAKRPGLLMVPNWMGVTERSIEHAKEIAGDDYVVLVADVYGKDLRPASNEEAGKASGAAYGNPAQLRARAAKALDVLKNSAERAPLDSERLAVFGYCFGGAVALELARSGADLDAAISFHGSLGTQLPAAKDTIKASVLVLNGAADPYVSAEEIAGFRKEFAEAGVDWQFVDFSGALHCFAYADPNPPPGCAVDARSAKRAYAMMEDFLGERFGKD